MTWGKTLSTIAAAFAAIVSLPSAAQEAAVDQQFDAVFGTEAQAPIDFDKNLAARIEAVADGSRGRIGVAAMDLSTGQTLGVLDRQFFPMASTSKIAVAATFMEGVEQGRWSLTSEFPLLWPLRSKPFSSRAAPVREGKHLPAIELIELMLTRSSNPSTDALLRVVGGPEAVNDWMRRNGIEDFSLDRDIATLVRDDGEYDPATKIDTRDAATPRAMLQLLAGLHNGDFLSAKSRAVILSAMSRCRTGKRRIPALMPSGAKVAHKTGSLNNTSSDVGFITAPSGRTYAVAIYVTGQGSRSNREARIARIARELLDGYEELRQSNYGG
ncbi:serine hydrolase [Pseudoblastomonas halimionae]|uniref:beta-lactamase n=1 Tax=Alteriqipengyuania halimionae TaxID=1926630 RepID=A0A6I4U6P6_9SPHN|nr:serine hydrolase [Alteriqipengyuania halimionae]MXP11094.1 serine hydrolase [Alteriqipengyuania halimionae]